MLSWMALAAFGGITSEGAAAFEDGRLEDAMSVWAQAAERGTPSGRVSYNLGVAQYRRGDFPRALVGFRAAARLRPRDGDVQHNLALARSELSGLPRPVSAIGWTRVLTPGELGVLGVAVTALGSLLLLGSARSGWVSSVRRWGIGVWLLGLVVGAVSVVGALHHARHPVAVVVDQDAVLRDAPTVNGGERFQLPPGTEVQVVQGIDGFLLVEDGRGRRGYVAPGAVETAWGG